MKKYIKYTETSARKLKTMLRKIINKINEK